MRGCAAECLLCYISLVMLGWAVSLPDTFRSTMSQSVNLGIVIVLLCVLKSICWSCPSQTLLPQTVTITTWVKDHIKSFEYICVFSGALFLDVYSASRDIPHIKQGAMIMTEISTVTVNCKTVPLVIFLFPSWLLEDI